MIYLDNAATTIRKPESVGRAVAAAVNHMGNPGRGAHGASLEAARVIYETRVRLSKLFGAGDPSSVAFTANSTEALNIAIQGLFKAGDHVITTMMEHNSVLRPLYLMEKRGVELTIVPAGREGNIRYKDLEIAIQENTKGIVCTQASNLTGNPVDLHRVGEICRKRRILFVVDASQGAGLLPVDMKSMGIDVLCFTGHKGLMGPQGTGGICVRKGLAVRPLLVGGSGISSNDREHPGRMPEALEAGTLNGHGIAGLNAALCSLEEIGFEKVQNREMELMRRFLSGVKQIGGVTVYGDFSMELRAPIVAINVDGMDSKETADKLAFLYDVCVRGGVHCAPLMHRALGTEGRGAVRFSMSYFNTEREIDAAAEAVREIARK